VGRQELLSDPEPSGDESSEGKSLAELLSKFGKEIKDHKEKFVFMDDAEFPLSISGVKTRNILPGKGLLNRGVKPGTLVMVKPCSDNPGDKTFLGLYLGEFPVDFLWEYEKETKLIHMLPHTNPAMLVPELNRIVWGMESWWGEIESVDQLKQITDEDIENVWYVQLLKSQLEKNSELPSEAPGEQEPPGDAG
jgi:hypothetical protein